MNTDVSSKYLEGKKYWEEQLLKINDCGVLPRDFMCNGEYVTRKYSFCLGKDLSDKMNNLCKENKIVLFIYLLSGFKILLHKVSQKKCVALGIPVYKESSFNETVFTVGQFNEGMSGRDLIKATSQTIKDAYKNQFVSLKEIFSLDDTKKKESLRYILALDSIHDISKIQHTAQSGDNEITVVIREKSGELSGEVIYNSLMFSEITIKSYMEVYIKLLNQLIENNLKKVIDIAVIEDDVSESIYKIKEDITDSNMMNETRSIELIDIFYDKVKEYGKCNAIVDNRKTVTYDILEQRVNKTTRLLKEEKIKKGDVVCIMVHDAVSAIEAILSISSIGGVYVIASPLLSKVNKDYILKDSDACFVLTKEEASSDLKVLGLHNSFEKEQNSNNKKDVLCRLYKIDVDGVPKGTDINKQQMINHLKNVKRIMGECEEERRLAMSVTLSPTASLWAVSILLSDNIVLYSVSDQTLNNSMYMEKFIEENKITSLTVPAFCTDTVMSYKSVCLEEIYLLGLIKDINNLMKYKESEKCRYVLEAFESCTFLVLYEFNRDSTESMWVTLGEIPDRYRLYIKDDNNKEILNGLPGELCIIELDNDKKDNDYQQTYNTGIKARKSLDGKTVEIYHCDMVDNAPHLVEDEDNEHDITDVERNLIEIWKNVLNIEKVSVKKKFFDMGGNSALLLKMVADIERLYPGVINVADAFSYPTIRELGNLINRNMNNEKDREKIGYKDIINYSSNLQEKYFVVEKNNKKYSTLIYDLDEDLCMDVVTAAEKLNISELSIIMASFLRNIASAGDGREAVTQFVSDSDENISFIELEDYGDDITNYMKKIDNTYHTKDSMFNIDDINRDEIHKMDQRVMSLFYDIDCYNFNQDILLIYDMLLGVSLSDEEISIIFRFNSQYLNKTLMGNLFSNIIDDLEIMVSDVIEVN